MRSLLVYFSHSGNNRLLAEHLATPLGCELCPIVEKRRRIMLTIFMDMTFNRHLAIASIACSIADYDRILLVAPIWGSKVANPMKSFLEQEKAALSDYAFISLCGHGTPEQKTSITRELTALAEHPPLAVSELKIRGLMPAEKRDDVNAITRYRVAKDELAAFEEQINEFLSHGEMQ